MVNWQEPWRANQQQVQDELARARANHRIELQRKSDELESEMEQVIADCRAQVQTHESTSSNFTRRTVNYVRTKSNRKLLKQRLESN